MSEIVKEQNHNSLFITEVPADDDNSSDNVFTDEMLDFGFSDGSEDGEAAVPSVEQNYLKIIEEKDLVMDENESDTSLQADRARVNVRTSSVTSAGDFEESEKFDEPHEAINQTVEGSFRRTSESHNDEGEGIVDLLGQINDIVGLSVSLLSGG